MSEEKPLQVTSGMVDYPKIRGTRIKLDAGLVGIGLFGLNFYTFAIPGVLGIWISIIGLVTGILCVYLDTAWKWPSSWKKRFVSPNNYNHWWVWLITACLWFVMFGSSLVHPPNSDWTGASFLVGILSAYDALQGLVLWRVALRLNSA